MDDPIEHIVAATLAAAKAASDDLTSRDEYLAEYDAFLELLIDRRRRTIGDVVGHSTGTQTAPILRLSVSTRKPD